MVKYRVFFSHPDYTVGSGISPDQPLKKRPADLSIIKRLGRFYWRKDNGNSWNDKDMLNLGLTDA